MNSPLISVPLCVSLALFFSPSLSPFCTAPSVWVYIYHPCVRPGEWARGMERKTIMPSLLALRSRPPINNYGWRASPTAHGMGIWSPSAQPWAARPPWEPFSQATEDGQQARAKSWLTAEEESSFFLTFFQPYFETVIVCLSVVSLRRVADCFIPLYLSLYGASFSFKAVLHCI